MKEMVFLCLLFLVPAWAAKLPALPLLGADGGAGRQLEPSFNDLLGGFGGYLPPDPGPADECINPTRTRTSFVTRTTTVVQTRPGPGGQIIYVTSTRVVPQTVTVTQPGGQPLPFYVTSTAYTTVFSTRFVTSTVGGVGQTRTVTRTSDVVSTILDYVTRTQTRFVTESAVITRTQIRTQTVGNTFTTTAFRESTRYVTQTIPGRTVFITRTVTDRNIVTAPGITQFVTRTNFITSTRFDVQTQTRPALVTTVFSTIVNYRTSTVLQTFRDQQTRFVTNTDYRTQVQTSVVFQTQRVTQTVTRSQVFTSTVATTVFSTVFQPSTVYQTRESTTVVRVPGQTVVNTVTRTRTTTIGGGFQDRTVFVTSGQTRTQYVTTTVGGPGGVITVTNTNFVPCTQQQAYNYDGPRGGVGLNLRSEGTRGNRRGNLRRAG